MADAFKQTTGPESDREKLWPARVLPGRFPGLWVLLPLIASGLFSGAGFRAPGPLLALGAVVATIAAVVLMLRPGPAPRRLALWRVTFPAGVFLTALLAADKKPAPDRAGLPPREAVISVRIDELFATASDTRSGIGTVAFCPAHLPEAQDCRIQFRVIKFTDEPRFDLGAVVRVRGVLENAPAGEGFARYLRQRGVPLTLSRARLEAIEVPASDFRIACTRARNRMATALATGVSGKDAARLAALMLGRTSLLPRAERDDFQKAGATHLFAISGLHITGIAGGLLWALRRIRAPDWIAVPGCLTSLWFYVQMTGASSSAMRAWLMAAAMFGARVVDRNARPAAGLIFAATLTLLCDPEALRDPGFLLSYLVVAAILFYAGPAARLLEEKFHPWQFTPADALGVWRRGVLACRRPVFAAFSTTFAATLAGAPLVAALFGNASPVGLFANLILVPVSGPPVILGFLSSLAGVAGVPGWAAPFNRLAALFMEALARGARAAASVPGGAFAVKVSAGWAVPVAGLAVLAALWIVPVRPDRSPWRHAILPVVVTVVFLVLITAGR